jgi:hypothetical protein
MMPHIGKHGGLYCGRVAAIPLVIKMVRTGQADIGSVLLSFLSVSRMPSNLSVCIIVSLYVHLFHPVSPKWRVIEEKDYKDKRRFSWRQNLGRILNFATICMGPGPNKIISSLLYP